MKFFVFLVFGVVCASAAVSQLDSDLNDLKALIPTDKIALIVGEHLLFDSQFRGAKKYLASSDFAAFWSEAINSAEFQAIIKYLASAGMDAVTSINKIAKQLNVADYAGVVPVVTQRSVESFVTSVFKAFPKSEITALVNSKLETSPAFKYFYTSVNAPAFNTLVQQFLNAPQLASGWAQLKSYGINPQEIITLFRGVFGF